MFTIVFVSLHSESHIKRLTSSIEKKFPIIVIENSFNHELKKELEEKYNNVKVIIPEKNLGLSGSYNLGIKESKTEYVFLNPSDVSFSNECLNSLEECVDNIKDFTVLAPSYDDERIYKNYEIWNKEKLNQNLKGDIFKKYKIKEVDFIDNDFIVNKKNLEKVGLFDENIFLYFETMDFCKQVRIKNEKIYVSENIKFTHFGSQSHDDKYAYKASLTRSWHYSWSKFYYFRKHFSYFFALKKIIPNFIKSIKRMINAKIKKNYKEYNLSKAEILGILNSIFLKKSSYRPYESE